MRSLCIFKAFGQPLDKKYQPDFICYDEVIARPPRPPASLCLAGGRA